MHAAYAWPSSEHRKLALESFELNENDGVVSLVSAPGPSVMVVLGALTSTDHDQGSTGPTLPALSVARTWKVWSPSFTENVQGLEQSANAPASSRHWKSAGSSAANTKVAVAVVAWAAGPLEMFAVGARVSTTSVRWSGVASRLPAASRARTAKLCWPSDSEPRAAPLVQPANAAPSTEHWNVAAGSSETKA